jgi:hypothetical protein
MLSIGTDTLKAFCRKDISATHRLERIGIGAVLMQMDDDGKEFVIAYASWSNNNGEAQYSSYEGECLADI